MITKEKALDVLDRMDFFQGQRAGRELWNEKSRYVQEMDLQIFREDVAELKAYIADVAPRAEVAREIFEEIEKHLFVIAPIEEFDGWARIQLADIMRLKKKYTEAEAEPPKGE